MIYRRAVKGIIVTAFLLGLHFSVVAQKSPEAAAKPLPFVSPSLAITWCCSAGR